MDFGDTRTVRRRGVSRPPTRLIALVALIVALMVGIALSLLSETPSSEEVVEAFVSEGLEVGTYYDVDDEWEGKSPVPQTYVEGTRFTIPSLKDIDPMPEPELLGPEGRPVPMSEIPERLEEADEGGRVFTFESREDLDAVRNYYEGLGRVSGWLDSHVYVQGNTLLQINGELPKEQAEEYGEVLRKTALRHWPSPWTEAP